VRYILTYSEIVNETSFARGVHLSEPSDASAIERAKQLLRGKEVKDITLYRRGDFVMLGRESV
jgi:hypothetical protein